MKKSTNTLIGKKLALGLLFSGIIATLADARVIDPPTSESKDSDTKTNVPATHPPAQSIPESSTRTTPLSETRPIASVDTHQGPLAGSTHPREETEKPVPHSVPRGIPESSADTQTAEDRARTAELLAAQQEEELKHRDAEIAALRAQLDQREHQQRKETETREIQRQVELEAKLDSTLDEFFPHIQPVTQHQPQSVPLPPQPAASPPPPQEPRGINGFLGAVFGQSVENTLNGPGRNFEKFVSSAAGRRGRDAQHQAFGALGALFSSFK